MEQVKALIKTLLVLSLLFSNLANADCPNKVQPIKQGEAAICAGYLFSPEAESEAYKAKQTSDLLASENDILNKRLQLYIQESNTLSQTITQKDNTETLYRFGYFSIGVLITSFIAVNIRR